MSRTEAEFFCDAAAQIPDHIKSGSARLVAYISFLQGLGIYANHMQSHGIGGYVAGCWIGSQGLTWAAAHALHSLSSPRHRRAPVVELKGLKTHYWPLRETRFEFGDTVCRRHILLG